MAALWATSLLSHEGGLARYQRRSARRFMSLISDLKSLDKMAGISFSDHASVMPLDWARAPIAYASHGNAVDGVVFCSDIDNLAAVASVVTEADNIWHNLKGLVEW